jgi:hypothetical protein
MKHFIGDKVYNKIINIEHTLDKVGLIVMF